MRAKMVLLRFLFTLSIFLPSLIVYAHEFSHHEHQVCEETSTHFHDIEDHCPVDDFILKTSFLAYFPYKQLNVIPQQNQIFNAHFFHNKHDVNQIYYRGPPTA